MTLAQKIRPLARRLALGVTVGALTAAAASAADYTMRFSTPTINELQFRWMQAFETAVEARTGGRLDVELYPANQLGPVASVLEGLQLGTIEANIAPFEFHAGIDPAFQIPAIPGMFHTMEEARARMSEPETREMLLNIGIDRGIRGIGAVIYGPTMYASRSEIKGLEDFKGLRMRVLASFTEIETTNALGASGVPMPLNEVPAALQQGAIDGAASMIDVFLALRSYQVAPYLVPTGLWYINSLASVSDVWFQSLPADIQTAIMEVAAETDAAMFEDQLQRMTTNRDAWVKNGGTIAELPAADQAAAEAAAAAVAVQFLDKNPSFRPLYERLSGKN